MESTHKCLKEWNATIEALGQGKQTILIRNYTTKLPGFLLYPTVSYVYKDNYLESFQPRYREFVKQNSLPTKQGNKVMIKYFATVEKIIEKPVSNLPSNYEYIWTRKHVKKYIKGKKAFIWVLRVYILQKHYWAEPTRGAIRYANLRQRVSLKSIQPVLSESEFNKIVNQI